MTAVVGLKKPVAIFFDLDGTLIDSAPDLGAAANTMRLARGLDSLPNALYRPMAGAGARGMLKVAFNMQPSHADFLIFRDEFFTNYQACIGTKDARTVVFEGVPDMLRGLEARGILWGIVTNKAERFTKPLVSHIKQLHGACVVVSGDTTAYAKPHPEPLFKACLLAGQSEHGLQPILPGYCWYLGDDKRDILAAQAAGMASIAVTWGYEGEYALDTWHADHVLHRPKDLLALLCSIDSSQH